MNSPAVLIVVAEQAPGVLIVVDVLLTLVVLVSVLVDDVFVEPAGPLFEASSEAVVVEVADEVVEVVPLLVPPGAGVALLLFDDEGCTLIPLMWLLDEVGEALVIRVGPPAAVPELAEESSKKISAKGTRMDFSSHKINCAKVGASSRTL